jgi:hypothetical protein
MERKGRGRLVGVLGMEADAGAAALARDLAEDGAQGGAALLIDLDLARDRHAAHYGARLGAAVEGRLFNQAFWADRGPGYRFFRVSPGRLFVGACPAGAELQLLPGPEYWAAARRACDLLVADLPSGPAADLAIAAHLDGVVLVVSERASSVRASRQARHALDQVGARMLGVVVIEAQPMPALLTGVLQAVGLGR